MTAPTGPRPTPVDPAQGGFTSAGSTTVGRPSVDAQPTGSGVRGAAEHAHANSVADARIRPLLERYCELAGGAIVELEPHLLEVQLPAVDRAIFRGAERLLIALSVDALERAPEAEMATVGSLVMQQLIDAIRSRGARLVLGLLPPAFAADAGRAALNVTVSNGTAAVPTVQLARHPVGRLLVRVVVRSGSAVEEHLVESGVFDLATGAVLGPDIAELCAAIERGTLVPAGGSPVPSEREAAPLAPAVATGTPQAPHPAPAAPGPPAVSLSSAPCRAARPLPELVPLMLADLKARLAADVERQGAEAERSLAAELARIDGYYRSLLDGGGGRGGDVPDAAARRAIEAEHARRRAEEERRHQVRAVVHPLHVTEWELLVQRAEWELVTPEAHRGTVVAQRALSGRGAWALCCPSCGATPQALVVCRHDHVGCSACGAACSICGEGFCREHGVAECHVDRRPACDAHARVCQACRRAHCTTHEAVCVEGDHPVCTACLAPCGSCGQAVCTAHARQSPPASPKGSRRLCSSCVTYCEGGTGEPVGRDEVTRCASCERSVCLVHQATCAVDGQVHCSTHLRRTDRTRRLVCERDRAVCVHERDAILAADEVVPCATCGRAACVTHTGLCTEDARRHCATHLSPLADRPGAAACEAHRTLCHVDGVAYSLVGTASCPVCERRACARHMRSCRTCGRMVCRAELEGVVMTDRCSTCRALKVTAEPSDAVLSAAIVANGGVPPSVKEWRTAHDATHLVVEMGHGWTRRTVFAMRHGATEPETVMAHSALGSSRRQ